MMIRPVFVVTLYEVLMDSVRNNNYHLKSQVFSSLFQESLFHNHLPSRSFSSLAVSLSTHPLFKHLKRKKRTVIWSWQEKRLSTHLVWVGGDRTINNVRGKRGKREERKKGSSKFLKTGFCLLSHYYVKDDGRLSLSFSRSTIHLSSTFSLRKRVSSHQPSLDFSLRVLFQFRDCQRVAEVGDWIVNWPHVELKLDVDGDFAFKA